MELFRLPEVRPKGQKALARRRCATMREVLLVIGRALPLGLAFGRTERLRERDRRVDRLQAMLEGDPLRLKPVPAN
jgi:hypothetical protein